ncbi:MAG: protein tyrosine phosphatase [Myxococcaceae bacterium]|nr:protein tyrosine phosphatase [Myxococcaceae bacterium]
MSGFVDLHLHLLPGVDDGAKTLDDTVAMARALVSLGYVKAAPSPHNRAEYAPKNECLEKLVSVQVALTEQRIPLGLHANSENFFLDERLLDAQKTPSARTLNELGKHMLVEAPYQATLPALKDILFRLQVKGVIPIIAHPERCLEFEAKGRAAEAVAAGANLQLDMAALIGRYGPNAKRLAERFLGEGLYAIAATDAHSPLKLTEWVGDSLAALEKAAGTAYFRRLVVENPERLLRGEPVV